mmetsp:Transcript_39089/g.80057  ORF Transcript_39089/g.80057 Transcript_39089/m.80057 type:complete len:81 (-) Transcript_39089:436-678(-)
MNMIILLQFKWATAFHEREKERVDTPPIDPDNEQQHSLSSSRQHNYRCCGDANARSLAFSSGVLFRLLLSFFRCCLTSRC